MGSKKYNVALAGATGAVGNQMITCLEERDLLNLRMRLHVVMKVLKANYFPIKKKMPMIYKYY
jgi:aspartate-semialdehyde dehydrogenase